MSLQRPLDCYRVLEIGTGPASYCGRVLADLGARVIHLEPPGGDPMKHQCFWHLTGCLDLNHIPSRMSTSFPLSQ